MGASADVLTAYRLIDEAGGLAIAAHVNSSHGVAMRGIDFGGQTKIAYTQDSHLHALEVTDSGQPQQAQYGQFFQRLQAGISAPHALHSKFRLAPPKPRSAQPQESGRV